MKPLPLSAERIKLRRVLDKDTKVLFRNYCSDSYSSKFLTRKPHLHINQTRKFLNDWCNDPWDTEKDQFGWVIALEKSDEAIGVFLVISEAHKVQIHFGVGRHFEGHGYITEAGRAVVQWLMNQPNLQTIWTVCDLLNTRSIKVLEKLGFQQDGILREWLILPAFGESARDCYVYTQTFSHFN